MLYSAFALLSFFATVYSQQTAAVIEVPLTSNGNQYSLRFLASSPLADVTRDFCISNAESLGISPLTEQSLPLCQQPVTAHIQGYVQDMLAREPAAQEVVAIQLEIGQRQYDLRFHPTAESILAVSRDFCISNAVTLGITPLTEASLPGCQTPVVEYMRAAAIRSLEERNHPAPAPTPTVDAIQVVLTILNQQVTFQVQPTEASVLAASREFCINNQAALGLAPLTEQTLPTCQQPVLDALMREVRSQLTAAAEKEVLEQVAEVKVTMAGNQYLVRFRPSQEPVGQVARDFCLSNAATLGLDRLQPPLTEQSLQSLCQQPVAQYLYDQVRTALSSA